MRAEIRLFFLKSLQGLSVLAFQLLQRCHVSHTYESPFTSSSVFQMDEVKSQAIVSESIPFYLCQKEAGTCTIFYVITWSFCYLQML